jgi:type IV secretion system protein TrbI
MADQEQVPGAVPVTDRRPVPSGVLPRRVQTWLMAGLALFIVGVIFLTGQKTPERPNASTVPPPTPNADRVRDYQERLRAMEARAVQDRQTPDVEPSPVQEPAPAAGGVDQVAAERRRKDYESLFASNIALSRRPELAGGVERSQPRAAGATDAEAGLSIDEIVNAVIRASGRAPEPAARPANGTPAGAGLDAAASEVAPDEASSDAASAQVAAQDVRRLLEGTVIDAVLTNRLDGSAAAPVNCLVTNPVYARSGTEIVIPAGARLLGWTRPVQALGETRLAVAFHRLVLPSGITHRLAKHPALNPVGDVGLKDKANHHYWSMFGAAGAVGLIAGLGQAVGSAGIGGGDGDRTVILAGGAADGASQASHQALARFLNRLPTVTIREGHRLKVYLTSDVELPRYVDDGHAR